MRGSQWVASLLVLAVAGCGYQMPDQQSIDRLTIEVEPQEVMILGLARGKTRRFCVLFACFGRRNSFQRAQRIAIAEAGAEMLLDRSLSRSVEGLVLPAWWLEILGFETQTDLPLLALESYEVSGTAVRFVPTSPADPGLRPIR